MKIYTYYEDINFKSQKKLLQLWEKSWKDMSFEPVILTLNDAKKSSYYDEYLKSLKTSCEYITSFEMHGYHRSCYLRWLAYSTQDEIAPFLVSDYDVINKNFVANDLKETADKLCLLNGCCPCISFGTKEQYLNFCKDITYYLNTYKDEIKVKHTRPHIHDQDVLQYNEHRLSYNICKAHTYVTLYEHECLNMKNYKLFHVAHLSVKRTKIKYPKFEGIDSDTLRIQLVEDILNSRTV